MPRPARAVRTGRRPRPAALAALVTVGAALLLAGCSTTYVDTSPDTRPADLPQSGWIAVDPIAVTLPTEAPLGAAPATAPDLDEPTLVNVWASSCGPCREEMPLLDRVDAAGDLQVVGLSRDVSTDDGEDLIADLGVAFDSWQDADLSFLRSLDGRASLVWLPASAMVADGEVVAVHVGPFHSRAEVLEGLDHVPGR
ncbi:TlpA family protein disulfide reductase [Nocardioides kribbensis]|uniref:TlpA family protein disulfide reductase n=1 Tax=Nocardioides kribbensis TaxID=305517 RepID=UPI0032DA5F58